MGDLPREYAKLSDVPSNVNIFVYRGALCERTTGNKYTIISGENFVYIDKDGIVKVASHHTSYARKFRETAFSLEELSSRISAIESASPSEPTDTPSEELSSRISAIEADLDPYSYNEDTVKISANLEIGTNNPLTITSDQSYTILGSSSATTSLTSQGNIDIVCDRNNDNTDKKITLGHNAFNSEPTPLLTIYENGNIDCESGDLVNVNSINGYSVTEFMQKDTYSSYVFSQDSTVSLSSSVNYFSSAISGDDYTITLDDSEISSDTKIYRVVNIDSAGATYYVEHVQSDENNVQVVSQATLLPGQYSEYLRLQNGNLQFLETNGIDKLFIRVTTPFNVSERIHIPQKYTWAWFKINGSNVNFSILRAVTGISGSQSDDPAPNTTVISLHRDYSSFHGFNPSGTTAITNFPLGEIPNDTSLTVELIKIDYQIYTWKILGSSSSNNSFVDMTVAIGSNIFSNFPTEIHSGLIIGGELGLDRDQLNIDRTITVNYREAQDVNWSLFYEVTTSYSSIGSIYDFKLDIPLPINIGKDYRFQQKTTPGTVSEPYLKLFILTY